MSPDTAPFPEVPRLTLVNYSKGTNQLGTFLALEQLLQQAGTECSVDVFNVALKQSQACGFMTPTLVRSKRGGGGGLLGKGSKMGRFW